MGAAWPSSTMAGLLAALCLSWVLALAGADPLGDSGHGQFNRTDGTWLHTGLKTPDNYTELLRRCADEEGFDAITLDQTGTMLFFRGASVWKGFMGAAEPIEASWPNVQGPIDAALRMHYHNHPCGLHDYVFLFKDELVWAYDGRSLCQGYPKPIAEEFPGVPAKVDAAVECHPKECSSETVLFFKGPKVFLYDLRTKKVKQRMWPTVSGCSAAVRWLERYYCFQGIHFLRFDPVKGDVAAHYPRDTRDYFMFCPGRGHGHETRRNATLWGTFNPCSGRPFQAFSSDDSGRIYAFRGGHYLRLDSMRDGLHPWPLNHTWPEMEGEVDAAFSWADKFYLIQGSQITIYRSGQGYHRVEGYPQPLLEELGVAQADAAFTCPHSHILYLIQGSHFRQIDLQQSPRLPGPAQRLPHSHVDSALCKAEGVFLFIGPDVYHYADVAQLWQAPGPGPAQSTATAFLRCPGGGPPRLPPHQG